MSGKPPGRSVVRRDCSALSVPSGVPVVLTAGTEVTVLQHLGPSLTVRTDRGQLARVESRDADAFGLEPQAQAPDASGVGAVPGNVFSLDAVLAALKEVFDPEIPINVVDLGLIYTCEATPLGDGSSRVEIEMSMTAPGCGMGDVLKADARRKVAAVPGVGEVDIELVWDPPWDLSRLSEDARLQLGMW